MFPTPQLRAMKLGSKDGVLDVLNGEDYVKFAIIASIVVYAKA